MRKVGARSVVALAALILLAAACGNGDGDSGNEVDGRRDRHDTRGRLLRRDPDG